MKRILPLIALMIAALSLMGAAPRTGSWTETNTNYQNGWHILTLSWTADSTGTVASKVSRPITGLIHQVVTDPDTSLVPAVEDSSGRGPSDNYDLTLKDSSGFDIMRGSLGNRDTANVEMNLLWQPVTGVVDTVVVDLFNASTLTAALTNNIIPNARGAIKIYWRDK